MDDVPKQDLTIPVIAIDGGARTGKGTVRDLVSKKLGFNSLDSGVLYRLVTLQSLVGHIGVEDEAGLIQIAEGLAVRFEGEQVFVGNEEVSERLRTPQIDARVPFVSKILGVRKGLHNLQLGMRVAPGLVADGRDMSYVFDTPHRFFLETDPEEKARRHVAQSAQINIKVDYDIALAAIIERDKQDRERKVSPLVAHEKATIINTTHITAKEVAKAILAEYRNKVRQEAWLASQSAAV